MYKVKHFIDSGSQYIYFAYVHSYSNYVNIAWGSTHVTKLIQPTETSQSYCRS